MFNGGIRGKRATDNQGTVDAQNKFIQTVYPQPSISGYAVSGSDDTALNPAGGQTVLVNGTGFAVGVSAVLDGVQIGAVTLVSSTQISFTSPAKAGGSYSLLVYNSTGGAAILVPGLTYSSIPTYTTPEGTIGTYYETTAISTQVVATSDSSITYSLSSGSLPSGATLYGNGVITGTSPVDSSSTTYTFAITATDAELQDVTRTFTLTINTDVVNWTNPSSNTSISLTGESYSTTLSATSAAGYGATYTANSLPAGLTLSSGVISGAPTVGGTSTTLLTATSNTTNRTAQRTITWTVNLGDLYWENVTLLLNGTTPTTSFINDASLNNSQLNIFGDTKPSNFDPYMGGYYSNFFDGDADYLTVPNNTALQMGSGDFTIEFWIYYNSLSGYQSPITKGYTAAGDILFQTGLGDGIMKIWLSGSNVITESTGADVGQWYHYALVRSGTTVTLYRNGVSRGTTTSSVNFNTTDQLGIGATGKAPGGGAVGYYAVNGYMSNVRIVKGTAVYTTTFTPSTTPLTAISNTVLLTCQSNRFIDNSLNNFAVTRVGATTVRSAHPFATPTTAAYNTLYSTYFDGTGDYLSVPTSTALDGFTDFTIEFWVYFNSVSGNQVLLNKGWDASSSFSPYVVYLTGGNIVLYAAGGGAWNVAAGSLIKSSPVVSTWYHIAVSRSGSSLRLFADGALTTTVTSSTTLLANSSTLLIGATTGGASTPSALISNLRIIKGTGIYTAAFTPSTSPLTTTSQGATANQVSLLTCQNATLIDNSTNNFTITSFGQAQPVALSPFTMTTSNTTITSLGSVYLDGTGDYLSWNPLGAGRFGTGDFTVELWFYPTVTMTTHYLLEMRDASNLTGWVLAYGVNVSGSITWYNGSGNLLTEASPSTRINQWNHVAFCRSGTSNRLFINGVQTNVTVTDATNYNNTNTTAYIGSRFDQNSTLTTLFTGYLADIRLVKGTALYTSNFLLPQTPLTAITNTTLLTCQYNGGATNNGFVDQSDFSTIVTKTGNATQGTFSPYSQNGWSNYFDGNGDYLTTGTNAAFTYGTGDFTIELWVYITANPADYAYIYAQGPNSTASICVYIQGGAFRVWNGSAILIGFTSYSLNTWYHVAVSRSGTTIRLFVNGTDDGSVTNSSNITTGSSYGVTIGRWAEISDTRYFTGYVSNLRVVKGTALYTSNFTPSTSPLSAIAGTQLLTCQSNRLIDNSVNNFTVTRFNDVSVQAYSPFGGATSIPTSYSTFFVRNSADYISSPASSAFAFGTSAYTIEGWFYLNSIATYLTIFEVHDGTVGPKLTTMADGALRLWNGEGAYSTTSTGVVTTNLWYHFAWVRESTSLLKLYINGTSVISVTSGTVVTQNLTGTPTVKLGTFTNYTHYMNGYISNFRITKGQALYTTTFTPSTSPLTTTSQGATASNVSLLICQSSTFIDNSVNNFTITPTNTPIPSAFNPFGQTTTTLATYTPSVNGGSMYFDGTGDSVYVGSMSLYGYSDHTIEFWAYFSTVSTRQGIIGQGWNAGNFNTQGGWTLDIGTYSGGLSFALGTMASGSYWLGNASGLGTFTVSQWYHIAIVRFGTSVKIYSNGVSIASGTLTSSTTIMSNMGYIRVGAYEGLSYPFSGYVSDVRISSGALYTSNFSVPVSPFTSKTLIGSSAMLLSGTSGGIVDYHSTNNLETVGDTKLASEDPYGGSYYSNYFDGTGDYLTAPNSTNFYFGTGDFTVEFWMYLTTDFTSGYGPCIGQKASDSTGGWQIYRNTTTNTTSISIRLAGQGGAGFADYATTVTPTTGLWQHWAVVRSGTTLTWYCNGTACGVTTGVSTNITDTNTTGTMNVGRAQTWSVDFLGYLSNVRVVKGTAVYTSAFTPSTTPLTAISGTQLLTCQSNTFKDNSSNSATITVNGNTAIKSFNPFQQNTGRSIYFDGTGDYLTTGQLGSPNLNLVTGDFTIEGWVYNTGAGAERYILSQRGASSGWELRINATNTLQFFFTGGSTQTSTGTIPSNRWVYIAVTRSVNSLRIFINGALDSTNASFTNGTSAAAAYPVYVGNSTSSGGLFLGYIKDLRITKGVARYTTTPPAIPTEPFPLK